MARAGLTPERLTRAGAELADEVGFERVSLARLARHFDVATASLYSHLAGSHDLSTRIAQLALAELADRLADALAGRSGRAALQAYGDVFRRYAREHPGRYAATRFPLDDAAAASSAGPRHAEMTRAILRGYPLGGEDQTHAVRLLGATVHGYVALELAGGFSHSEPDSDRSWSRILDALDAVLTRWPAPAADPAPPDPITDAIHDAEES